MKEIKVGDKVRFLSAKGGGIVRRIEGKVAWVEGDDGFELPTPMSQCVRVEENDSFIPAYKPPVAPQKSAQTQDADYAEMQRPTQEKKEEPKVPMPHLLIPERKDGDVVSIYMAWLLVEPDKPSTSDIECYLINDSNYTLIYQLLQEDENGLASIISEGEIERDTKLFIEEGPLTLFANRNKMKLSYIPFKRDKQYPFKPANSIVVELDAMRLVKKHAYRPNDFFDDDAIVVTLIEKDKTAKTENLKEYAKELQQKVAPARKEGASKNEGTARKPIRKKNYSPYDPPLEIDLHIESLVSTTAGMSPADIINVQLDEFRKVMEDAKDSIGQRIVFIHGKGEGVLRKAIVDELKKKYPKAYVQDASYKDYGFGATMVTIH